MRVNLLPCFLPLLLAACGPAPRAVPPLPAEDAQPVSLPDSPRVVWRNDVGSGIMAALEARGQAVFATTTSRTVVALAQSNGRRFWLQRFQGAISTGPTVSGDRIYFATEDLRGEAHALDAARGRKIWSRRIGSTRLPAALAENRVFFATDAGLLYALDAADGTIIWRTEFSAAFSMAPLPHQDALLVATAADSLYIISTTDGTVLRRHALSATPSAAPALLDGALVLPLHDNTVVGIDAITLEPRFQVQLDAPVLAPVRVSGRMAYVLTRNAALWRIVDGTGERLADLRGAARASLTQVSNQLLVGLLDGRLIALDEGGRRLWEQQLPRSVVAPAVVSGSALFVPLINGEIWKLER